MRALVAFDGSESAYTALDLAASLTWPKGSEVRLLCSVPYENEMALMAGPWPSAPVSMGVDFGASLVAETLRSLDVVASRFAKPGVAISTAVLRGHPAETICDDAATSRAQLIIVGSRGHGALASALLGSTSAAIVDHAPCPVLVARTHTVRHILLGTDGSPAAAAAGDLVSSALFGGASVRAIAVADTRAPWWVGLPEMAGTEISPALDDMAEAARVTAALRTEAAQAAAAKANCAASTEVREGDPADTLLAAAKAQDIDLIALGSRGHTGWRRMMLGSVARAVLLHASCSVLIAHAPKLAAQSKAVPQEKVSEPLASWPPV